MYSFLYAACSERKTLNYPNLFRVTPFIFAHICILTVNIVHKQIVSSCKYCRRATNYADSNKTSNIRFTFLV